MTAYRIVAIDSRGYRPMPAMPPDTTQHAALLELIRASATRRTSAVVLRDGSTGLRTSVAHAMDTLGLTWLEKWNTEAWLAQRGAA